MAQSDSLLNFPDAAICVAVDTSGSTAGTILGVELAVVQTISNLRSARSEKPLVVLPWNEQTSIPIRLPESAEKLETLRSERRTDPSCLCENFKYVLEIEKSDLWFLFTDGEIEDEQSSNFANAISKHGLHGVSCVTVVFGNRSDTTVAESKLSVGYAAFALPRDSMILFHDIFTGTVNLMQAKGCFHILLKGADQPDMSKDPNWDDLPVIHYSDFAMLKLNPSQKLTEYQTALDDGTKVTLDDLYRGNVSDQVLRAALEPKNLSSIVMSENLRGRGRADLVDAWLTSLHIAIPPNPIHRADFNNSARDGVAALIDAIRTHHSEDDIACLRSILRAAHNTNETNFVHLISDHKNKVKTARRSNKVVQRAFYHSASMQTPQEPHRTSAVATVFGHGVHTEPEIEEDDEAIMDQDSGMEWTEAPSQPVPDLSQALAFRAKPAPEQTLLKSSAAFSKLDECALPGFKRLPEASRAGSEFVGKCQLCHRESLLAVLFSGGLDKDVFGAVNSRLPYPTDPPAFSLNDISVEQILASVVCDACAPHVIHKGITQHGQEVCAAIALVSAKDNAAVWSEVLYSVLQGAVRYGDLFKAFLAVLESESRAKLMERANLGDEQRQWAEAISWMMGNLEKAVDANGA